MPARQVVVIGGGLAGLAAAVSLADQGFRVALFERRAQLGGRATSYVMPGGRCVDNCQHVTLGCCTNLAHFFERIGASNSIHWFTTLRFSDGAGRRGILKPGPLPAPLHLAGSFAGFPLLSSGAKRAVARLLLHIVRSGGRAADADERPMSEWLIRHRQPAEAVERFWRVVLVSALNEQLERADTQYSVDVFWKAFLCSRKGFELGIPAVPLAQLYRNCSEAIESRSGSVCRDLAVRSLWVDNQEVMGCILEDGRQVAADYVIAAVPPKRLAGLIPSNLSERYPEMARAGRLGTSPITGIHCWFDRVVMDEPYLALIDQPIHWIFNKTRLYGLSGPDSRSAGVDPAGSRTGALPAAGGSVAGSDGQYLQMVVSASHGWAGRSREEAVQTCLQTLASVLPLVRGARLVDSVVIREPAATFSAEPGCDRWRPEQRTPLRRLFLAGDWTRTGWPGTMEGAVRSGYLAAEAVGVDAGSPFGVLQPELSAGGLAAFLGHL